MRLTAPRTPSPDEPCVPGDLHPTGYFEPLAEFIIPSEEGRLIVGLRSVLQDNPTQPVQILAQSALAFLRGEEARGRALADLAVTGQTVYESFRAQPPREADVLAAAEGTLHDARLSENVARALDRAYRVAWILRGFADRASLGWIAVSGEDDPPHRPVNTPRSRYRQFDLEVAVQGTRYARGRTVRSRFALARREADVPPAMTVDAGVAGRVPPPEASPALGDGERLILFIHGHSSQAEEFEDLAPPLVEQGFSVVAMDLPCNGYSSMFDHTEIADDQHTDSLEVFPVLEFIEQFIVDFVYALGRSAGHDIRNQIAAVIGGSLGGNMGLRLAQRDPAQHPFLANIISWSAASVWEPFTGPTLETGPNHARAWMKEGPPPASEESKLRGEYFYHVFDEHIDVLKVYAQPTYWYRDGWEPCKRCHIAGSRAGRREIYNRFFRRWHWRVALEQMLFSHRYQDRYQDIKSRLLLMAGEADNYAWSHIYDSTKDLAVMAINTPGNRLLLKDTGHSIHNERPRYLAQTIHDFLSPARLRVIEEWGGWESLGGVLTSRPATGLNEDGRIEVFARGTDNHVWHVWQTSPNGGWSGWLALDQGVGRDDVFGQSIAVGVNYDGRMEVFAQLARQKWIAHVWQLAANGGWGPWDKGNDFSQLIGGADDAVCAEERFGTAPGEISREDGLRFDVGRRFHLVAARRSNGRIHIRGQNSFGWWTNGKDLGNDQASFVGVPAIGRRQDGCLNIFTRDEGGRVFHISEASPDLWVADWVPLSGGVVTSDLAAARTADGRIAVFARGTDGALWYAWHVAPNGGWSGWQSLGGSLAAQAAPAVVKNGWNELEVFVRWSDGSTRWRRLVHNPEWSWTEWASLGGIAIRDPAAAVNADGTLVVFVIGTDGALYANAQRTSRHVFVNHIGEVFR
jgi:alpha-beta hydrolase superfamily lysophospholipase